MSKALRALLDPGGRVSCRLVLGRGQQEQHLGGLGRHLGGRGLQVQQDGGQWHSAAALTCMQGILQEGFSCRMT